MKARINEIFPSIQGEGPVVGYKQLFIRFCNCNLNCVYCDTEFANGIEYTATELYEKITSEYELETFHSISLTGGEPLLQAEFLKEFLPLLGNKILVYLETNATLFDKLPIIKAYIDIISADIKLISATGLNTIELHKKFFKECSSVETFAKVVFDNNITEDEINACVEIGKEFNIELVLQPKMIGNTMSVSSEFCSEIIDKFTSKYHKVRLIPQVHKFIDVR